MRRDLAQRLGASKWSLQPLWGVAPRVDNKNRGMLETNLLSLSYGQIIRKDIAEIGGLQPGSYETYNIIEPGDTVLRMTDLQNDQKSIRTGLARERGIVTSAYVTVRPNDRYVEPRFFSAILRAYDIKKVFYEMGAGVRQTLKYDELAQLPIPLPPLETQRRIADWLDRETSEIDAMIEKLDSLGEQLSERKSILPSNYFVGDYERVKLKWLLDEVDVRAGEQAAELPLLSVSIHHGVQLRDGSLTNQNPSENLSHYKVALPDQIVLNRMRAFQGGGLGVSKWDGLVSPDYSVLQLQDDLAPGWAEFMMRTPEFVSTMTKALRGIGGVDQGNVRTPRINVRDLLELSIPLPPLEEQRRIADHLHEVTSKIDAMLAKVSELKDLLTERRAALITDVVTGRKDVA